MTVILIFFPVIITGGEEARRMTEKIVIEFRPYVGVRPGGAQKAHRVPQMKLMSDFVDDLAKANGGIKIVEVPIPSYDEYGNIAFYLPEKAKVEEVDRTVLLGKVFVDYANGKIIIAKDAQLALLNGVKVGDLYSQKKKPRVKRVPKVEGEKVLQKVAHGDVWEFEYIGGDHNNPVSYKDKYSYKCATCGKVYGYQYTAENCAIQHLPRGIVEGDLYSAGVAGVVTVLA